MTNHTKIYANKNFPLYGTIFYEGKRMYAFMYMDPFFSFCTVFTMYTKAHFLRLITILKETYLRYHVRHHSHTEPTLSVRRC